MARAWSGNSGIQLAGTPMSELLCWIPERFALLAIRTRAWAIPWFSVTFVDVALYAAKAASQFGIGTPDAPSSSKPPLSRWLVVVIEELTSAWMPDIVAIVNMTSAMLANVAPVRNFLFIGYAIAVRTTGRQVRPRTRRVATARIVSLMNRVMSALAVLKNFQGLRSQASMRTPAAVKTRRGDVRRMVRTASPTASADGPASCRIRFWVTRERTVPTAPKAANPAPTAT